ncbi:ABL183Wp [Eremothecium gossypii ATCC 10895]|uniref:ABL183Wp n=1 Tax=Eremothecium gossypii (strain ATCC 10895 / CBS 109.51 / FGSC 9923 / NRRL Y-1056) TaxID=284811 RepID=Q75E53_EREGS|nr:ABL183Wp [Eremothecium gossypii ATCC 10895]AAS50588.1 ABL183Wp [Eremothecium gossypii ATCC 10895]AEY94876.1 FABL183Wp [Eremothecium gossypii FDAG1]
MSSRTGENLIKCPVCGRRVAFISINSHLDACTAGGGRKERGTTSVSEMLGRKHKLEDEDSVTVISDVNMEDSEVIEMDDSPQRKRARATGTVNSDQRELQKMAHLPLSEKLRPRELREYVGQQHILSQESGALYKYVSQGTIPSMILWGPPGVGKTSLARLLSKTVNARPQAKITYQLVETSATKANAQELRTVFDNAKKEFRLTKRMTVLFVDEIHRFNKGQQDLLLPYVESGGIVLIGATTENPSFQLNNALLSRCQVFVLNKLTEDEMNRVLTRGIAMLNKCRRLLWENPRPLKLEMECIEYINRVAVGDTRKALNILEMVEVSTRQIPTDKSLQLQDMKSLLQNDSNVVRSYYDAGGENHYDTISAFHKAIRGSDENAALYYLARMLQGGEDPLFIARRMVRIASEDIGLADNTMLPLAVSAHDAVMKVGLPEADLSLAHCAVALARAPKSVLLYRGWKQLKGMLSENKYQMASSEIPLHLRNAPTKLMKDLGYGAGYKYNPTYKDGKVKQEYFPLEVLANCTDRNELRFLAGPHLGTEVDPD